jgi:alkanesulfonate monooxygenase SsuD/methylene tetrahydromethanopterin reductase-like flavin-dependent oxidoreductase (luciferase family)
MAIDGTTKKFGSNRLRIGLFSPNCSGGLAITSVPERWVASWDNNVALAKMSDEAGIDFILPIARWIGYGGETGFQDTTLETITWATGLLASTRDIRIFATAHVAFMHPLVAAKQFSTMSHVARGRFGLNVVCGWNKPEYETFGLAFADEHVDRYAFGKEWLDIVRRVWSSTEPFDWNGDHFHLKGAFGSPLPYDGRPLIFNAGFSTEGRAFAEKNADYLLTTLVDIDLGSGDVRSIKEAALTEHGRDVDVIATSHVVCRPTMAEAQAYYEYYSNERADWPAVDRLMELQALHAKSFPPEAFKLFRQRFAAGFGTYPIVGDPDHVASELARISAAGFAGTTVSFVNYLDELPYFRDEVLPRLEAKGLRSPAKARGSSETLAAASS